MAQEKVEDVVRHYSALTKSLHSEDALSDANIVRVLGSLGEALSNDGFDIKAALEAEEKEASVTSTLRVVSEADVDVLVSVFSHIPRWKAKKVSYGANFFVVLSNASRLTEKRIKQSLKDYLLAHGEARESLRA